MSIRFYSLDRQACLLVFCEHISTTSGCVSVQQIFDIATASMARAASFVCQLFLRINTVPIL